MWSSTTPLELLLVNNWKIFHRAFTSLQININNEHLSSIWPGNGYHLPWLLFQLVPEESWRLSLEVNDHHHIITKAILIITFLRCCFWSPIILLVCVARQVNLWRNRSETYFVPKVTQSFLPRVARPTPSVAKLSSTETNGTRVAKTDGRRSKTKWILPQICLCQFWLVEWKSTKMDSIHWSLRDHVPLHILWPYSFPKWK